MTADGKSPQVVDQSLPLCGICDKHKDCANCIDVYGRNIDCGWPICRTCRDQGQPEGNVMPQRSWDLILDEGMDLNALMVRALRNLAVGMRRD